MTIKTMAKDLSQNDLLNILVRYGKPDAWNCQGPQVSDCKARYGAQTPSDYSKAVSFPTYFAWENENVDGHNASIFIRRAEISLPFIIAKKNARL